MSEATYEHSDIDPQEHASAEELLPQVYEQLRALARSRMANERDDHTLQPTALVHEAYQRLTKGQSHGKLWDNEGHFFAAAAKAMRRILIESARSKKRQKRGGNAKRVELDLVALADAQHADRLLDVDEGLRRLALEDVESAALVELRLFGGLSVTEAGEILGQSRTTAYENWSFARCWFATFLQ